MNSRGRAVRKQGTSRAGGGGQAGDRTIKPASRTHQDKQWQCPAGRQHGHKQVNAGECGSAAKCLLLERFLTPWDLEV